MLNSQHLTSRKLALLIALVLAIPVGILVWVWRQQMWEGAIALLVYFVAAYVLIHFLTERFIFRKIKLIFKFIYKTKAGKKEEMYHKYILPGKTLEEVSGNVESWAVQKEKELELLKKNEDYRREFLQNLAHEFKTPVFSILGYVETLMDGKIENTELSKKFLGNTHKNILRIVSLINDLDEISRLENAEHQLNLQYYDISQQVKDVFESCAMQAAGRNMHCILKKGSEPAVFVHADKDKIARVLTNLVANAIKYGKEGGHILAGIYQTDDETILVELSDNGEGIEEDELSRIFERFYRTESGRVQNPNGSGLGLSICKHIIEAHNHTIHARSKRGVGTTIGFTLSVAKSKKLPFA